MSRKVLSLLFILTFSIGVRTFAEEKEFRIDFFGYKMDMSCSIAKAGAPARNFEELVNRNLEEIGSCYNALEGLFNRHKFQNHNYGQLLLMAKFAEGLKGGRISSGWVSFSDVVLDGKMMTRNDRIALIYALLKKAGFGARIVKTKSDYYILVRVKDQIAGSYFKNYENFRMWEPGLAFEEFTKDKVPKVLMFPAIFNDGEAVSFDSLGNVPWTETEKGEDVEFRSLEKCPVSWNFTRKRLPAYEEFIRMWPRMREIQARVSDEVFKQFNFAQKLNPELNPEVQFLKDDELGNCLFKWLRVNTSYAPGLDNLRNPVETFFKDRKGDCDELSLALLAILREAGFPKSNIRLAIWHQHMNLGVAPLGEVSAESFLRKGNCQFEEGGRTFYIMDPSYLCLEKTQAGQIVPLAEDKCPVKWGICSYENLGGRVFTSKPIGGD